MTKWTVGVLLCLILHFVLFTSIASAEPFPVSVDKVSGAVHVMAGSREWNPLKNGDNIREGSVIRTGAESSCLLKWAGGNVIKLDSLTVLTVYAQKEASGAEKSSLDLTTGRVFARAKTLRVVDSTFQIKTPTAIAGVRGTEFYGAAGGGSAEFGVTGGSIIVAAGGSETTVEAGMSVSVNDAGDISEPAPIPDDVLQDLQGSLDEVTQAGEADQAAAPAESVQGDASAATETSAAEEPAAETASVEESPAAGESAGDTTEESGGGAIETVDDVADQIDTVTDQLLIDEIQNQIDYGEIEMEIIIDSK